MSRSPKDISYHGIYLNYKSRMRRSKLRFTLTFKQFKKLILSNCKCCGASPNTFFNPYINKHNVHKRKALSKKKDYSKYSVMYNTIDRIDNNKGYTKKNSRSFCWTCNRSRGTLTDKEYRDYIRKLINYRINKGLQR